MQLGKRTVDSVGNNVPPVTDIQSVNRNFSRKKHDIKADKDFSGGFFKPFFFRGSKENSIFDSGLQNRTEQKIDNLRIKSLRSSEDKKPEYFGDGKIVNLRRIKRKIYPNDEETIKSSFSAGVRNIVRNALYNRAGEKVETGFEPVVATPKPVITISKPVITIPKPVVTTPKPVVTISPTRKIEKPTIKSSLQKGKKQFEQIQDSDLNKKTSFYETYKQQIKTLKKEEFLDDVQKETIRKQQEKIRLELEKKLEEKQELIIKIKRELKIKEEQERRRKIELKLESEQKRAFQINREQELERETEKKREMELTRKEEQAKILRLKREQELKKRLEYARKLELELGEDQDQGFKVEQEWLLKLKREQEIEEKQKLILKIKQEKEKETNIQNAQRIIEPKDKTVFRLRAFKLIIQEAFNPKFKRAFIYSTMIALVILVVPVTLIALKGMREKNSIEKFGTAGYGNLKEAQASIEQADVKRAGRNFELAYENFLEARKKLDEVGGSPAKILQFVPGISKIESGRKLAQVGENVSLAGGELSQAMSLIIDHREDLKNNLLVDSNGLKQESDMSLTDMVVLLDAKLKSAKEYIQQANQAAEDIDLNDFPKEEREKILTLQKSLPEAVDGLNEFSKYTNVFLEILGENGGRKYLILFQNNHEVRATGGFVGTYGIVKVNQGRLENIKVEGIYNPDGQLKEKIIPPKPIQKMSATWSMHDANWWPDFPTSAEKISWFYEKTEGPTVDGIISLTPKVIQELLDITGPIEIEGYGPKGSMTIDHENFIDEVQHQVEVDYDKEENKPKKILADMMPLVINKIFSAPPEDWPAILAIFSQALKERNLMFYSFDYDIQELISDMGWSGEVLDTTKDYLSVINTNISGLKTDGVIKQKINHQVEVQEDGAIIDTVTVKRKHEGGHENYDWYNATNCDWMRVYVPQGSELISASGFTREFVDPPLDYEKLDFKDDFQVKKMEESYHIDEDSATRIYEEGEKTVFANWVYVSPGETATVSYKYLLPFRLDLDSVRKPADAYSLLIQKQSGAENVELESQLTGLDSYEYVYKYPPELGVNQSGWNFTGDLSIDKFFALIVRKK